MRILRFLTGLVLIPICVSITLTLGSLIRSAQPASDALLPAPALALGAGFVLWLFLCFTLPLPVRTYILAHELTHALWGSLMGATVSGIKISKERGSVTLSHSNFLITLAPYFFPLYTMIVIIAFYVLSIFYDTRPYYLVWLGLVGFTWGFHFTFTVSALMQRQTDIREYGYLLSYTTIYALNALGIAIWTVAVSDATFEYSVRSFAVHTTSMWNLVLAGGHYLAGLLSAKLAQ